MLPQAILLLLSSLAASVNASNAQCTPGPGSDLASYLSRKFPRAIPAARTFCSSRYPVTKATTTRTAPAITVTITAATSVQTTDVSVITATLTTVTGTTTITRTEGIFETTSTVGTLTVTDTETDTSTATTTVTALSQNPLKRSLASPAPDAAEQLAERHVPPFPTCTPEIWSYLKSHTSIVSAACACIETQKTVTATVTPSTTLSVTSTLFASATPTVTTFISTIATTFQGVEGTDVVNVTATTTTISTTTLTLTSTTVVATRTATVPYCDPTLPSVVGSGGCQGMFCTCDIAYDGGLTNYGICNDNTDCGPRCNSGLDCPIGQACVSDNFLMTACGGPTCVDTTGCTSSYTPPPPPQAVPYCGVSLTADGCSSNCQCESTFNGTTSDVALCNTGGCNGRCSDDSDCAAGQACFIGVGFQLGCGGPTCADTTMCSSTYTPPVPFS